MPKQGIVVIEFSTSQMSDRKVVEDILNDFYRQGYGDGYPLGTNKVVLQVRSMIEQEYIFDVQSRAKLKPPEPEPPPLRSHSPAKKKK